MQKKLNIQEIMGLFESECSNERLFCLTGKSGQTTSHCPDMMNSRDGATSVKSFVIVKKLYLF